MARKIDEFDDFFMKDIQKEEDILEITSYLEEADYKLEDLEYILYAILMKYMEKRDLSKNNLIGKRYLN